MPILELSDISTRTVPDLLDRAASFGLSRPFLIDATTGSAVSYGQFLESVAGAAARLATLFNEGDRVALIFRNSIEYLILRYGLSCAGLTEVAINGEHRGWVLRHMLEVSKPVAIIASNEYYGDLEDDYHDMLVSGEAVAEILQSQLAWNRRPKYRIEPRSIARILFTSGTTSGSKGVLLSHAYEIFTGYALANAIELQEEDRLLYFTPLFHADAQVVVSALLHCGGAIGISPRFSASGFWPDVVRFQATGFLYVGSILAILNKQDPCDGHSLRFAIGGGCPAAIWESVERRLGISIFEAFGMTECICPTINTPKERRIHSCGRPNSGYEIAIADEWGRPVPHGKTGEILVRSREPFGLMNGYCGDPAATLSRMENQWFHTEDLGLLDEDGFLYFHGRIKDVIRRRGENISAEELEGILATHPKIVVSAAIAVPSDLGDDDLLIYVEPRQGVDLSPQEIADFLDVNVAPFMRPKFIKVEETLPRTATEKIAKSRLSKSIDDKTWTRI